MSLKHLIGFFIGVFLATACQKNFDIDIPNNPKPVVNCLIHPDSLWKLNLVWSSAAAGEYTFTNINGAQVEMKWIDKSLILDKYVEGKIGFYSNSVQKVPSIENADIRMEIKIGDTVLTANTRIPPKPQVDLTVTSLQMKTYLNPDGEGIERYSIQGSAILKINRPLNDQRYYSVSIGYRPYTGSPSDSAHIGEKKFQDYLSMRIDDPRCILSISKNEGYLLDLGSDGTALTEIFLEMDGGIWYPYEPFEYFVLVISSITKEYYNYGKKIVDQYIASRDPFGEPVRIPSNIQGGIGIFSGYNSTCLIIPVNRSK